MRRANAAALMDIRDSVIDDRKRGILWLHRSSMTSLGPFQREREPVSDRCWIYLGDESELERPWDYHRRTVAGI